MRTHLVVVAAVVLDDDSSLGDAEHEFAVQTLVTQGAVEALGRGRPAKDYPV